MRPELFDKLSAAPVGGLGRHNHQLADVPLSARPFRAENGAVVVR